MKASELKDGDTVSIELKVQGNRLVNAGNIMLFLNSSTAQVLDFTLVNRPVVKVKKYFIVTLDGCGTYDISGDRYSSIDSYTECNPSFRKAISIIEHSMREE